MPQYEMDRSGTVHVGQHGQVPQSHVTWDSLDEFTRGYIECMFFTENAPGVTTEQWNATDDHLEGSIPDDVGFGDIAPESLEKIIQDCAKFQAANQTALEAMYQMDADGLPYNPERAGYDYWLTRNGHGAGFWSRDWDDPRGDTYAEFLSRESKHREVYVYLGDAGKVWVE